MIPVLPGLGPSGLKDSLRSRRERTLFFFFFFKHLFLEDYSEDFDFNFMLRVRKLRDFPGDPLAKTPCSQCMRPGFDPWSRELDPTCRN